MSNLSSRTMTFLLCLLTAIGSLASAVYLPAFPTLAQVFGVGAEQIQLTLTAYMLGLAIAPLLYGPLSDRYGRRPVLIGGLTIFILGSLTCMQAVHIPMLIFGRFCQAVGAASGMVLSRAIVRDIYPVLERPRALAQISSTTAVVPALAPLLGSFLVVNFGWVSIFFTLTVAGLLTLILIMRWLPESLDVAQQQPLHLDAIVNNYCAVVKNTTFWAYTLMVSLMFASHYAFLSSASFILIDIYHSSEYQFGFYYLAIVAGLVTGNQLGTRRQNKLSSDTCVLIGMLLLTSGGLLMALLVLADVHSALSIVGPYILASLGAGFLLPHAIGGALAPFSKIAGTASAMMGVIQMSAAATATAVLGYLYNETAVPVALSIVVLGLAGLVVYATLIHRRNNASEPAEK